MQLVLWSRVSNSNNWTQSIQWAPLWLLLALSFIVPERCELLELPPQITTTSTISLATTSASNTSSSAQTSTSEALYQSGPIVSILNTPLELDFVTPKQIGRRPSNRDRWYESGGQRSNLASRQHQVQRSKQTNSQVSDELPKNHDIVISEKNEPPSTDCLAKREEVQRRISIARNNTSSSQKPKINYEDEFVPQCNERGQFEPVQCHKAIEHCWCVNKYGQAIRNSASQGRPDCSQAMYESSTDSPILTTGISPQNLRELLREGDDASTDASFDSDYNDGQNKADNDSVDAEFNRRVSNSPEPSLSLIPNECGLSRAKAMERAARHLDENIWIPDCDMENQNLYSNKQCHKTRICWCVDQSTGLPLRSSEQLSKQPGINCTEIRRVIDMSVQSNKGTPVHRSFINEFSESCDADRRYEFLITLLNQFRQQVLEQIKTKPGAYFASLGSPSEQLDAANNLNDTEIAEKRFTFLDLDQDGKLNDREWSRFKVNFRLVDKAEEMNYRYKTQFSGSMTALNILRSQRRCWRDFLKFCGNGDLLNDESVSLSKWLSCVELPPSIHRHKGSLGGQQVQDIYAYSKAAAITRSKNRNPFLGILKPD